MREKKSKYRLRFQIPLALHLPPWTDNCWGVPSPNPAYEKNHKFLDSLLHNLTFEHDEVNMKPVRNEAGRMVPREGYRIDTVNCGDEDFAISCLRANMQYKKNSQRRDIKSHHYIISFDPRDAADNGLTVDKAQ